MSQQFIRLPYRLLNDPSFKQAHPYHKIIFLEILTLACWKSEKIMDGGKLLTLEAGEVCISFRELAEKCGKPITKNFIEGAIRYFVARHFLRHQVRQRRMILKVLVEGIYDTYEQLDQTADQTKVRQKSDSHLIVIDKQMNRQKEKVKKENPSVPISIPDPKIAVRDWVELTGKEHTELIAKHGEPLASQMLDILDSYNTTKQRHYASDYGALKTGGWVYQEAIKRKGEPGKNTNGYSRPKGWASYSKPENNQSIHEAIEAKVIKSGGR